MCSAKTFLRDETGAISVDWIVMTAAATFLALGVAPSVETGTSAKGEKIATAMADMEVGASDGSPFSLKKNDTNTAP